MVVAQRGHKSYIDTFPGRDLDNPFQGNIVDVCPVGALVHEDFVFKARAWDMDATAGICPGCSTGCNVTVDTKENQIVRLKPRHNARVNSYWMCDHGRKHLVMSNRGVRAEVPLIRDGDELRATDWATAIAWVVAKVADVGRPGGLGIASPDSSNENLFFFARFLDRLGIDRWEYSVPQGETAALPTVPMLQLRADRAANGVGAELLGGARVDAIDGAPASGEALVVLEDSLAEVEDGFGSDAAFFLYLGSRLPPGAREADAVFPIGTFSEMDGTFTNFERRVQRFHQALQPPGIARQAWMVLSRILSASGDGDAVDDVGAAFGAVSDGAAAFRGLSWAGLGLEGAVASGERAAVGMAGSAGAED